FGHQLLYTLVIVALALVQACQIHHNLTFPAANEVSDCSAQSLGHLAHRNRSLTSSLPTSSISPIFQRLGVCFYGK
ncbi:hypothetical protein KR018_002709, partial [Drosophila ironensis]